MSEEMCAALDALDAPADDASVSNNRVSTIETEDRIIRVRANVLMFSSLMVTSSSPGRVAGMQGFKYEYPHHDIQQSRYGMYWVRYVQQYMYNIEETSVLVAVLPCTAFRDP